MDSNDIFKSRQENSLSTLEPGKGLNSKETINQVEVDGKQTTQNSNNSQSTFDLPSFKCDFCSYESIWKHAVKRHQLTHYRGQVMSEDSKKSKYQCEACSFTSNNWTILKDHQKLHASPKRLQTDVMQKEQYPSIPCIEKQIKDQNDQGQELNNMGLFTCKKCTFKASYKAVFDSHKKVHLPSRDEIFQCDLCNFNSVYKQSFVRHVKKMHDNELNKEVNVVHYDSLHQKEIDRACDVESQNNNLPHKRLKPVESQELSDFLQNKFPAVVSLPESTLQTSQFRQPIARTRRGKYSDVPVKTTKDGLFECEHCSYQTAIRTALVKHQKNHLKNAKS